MSEKGGRRVEVPREAQSLGTLPWLIRPWLDLTILNLGKIINHSQHFTAYIKSDFDLSAITTIIKSADVALAAEQTLVMSKPE